MLYVNIKKARWLFASYSKWELSNKTSPLRLVQIRWWWVCSNPREKSLFSMWRRQIKLSSNIWNKIAFKLFEFMSFIAPTRQSRKTNWRFTKQITFFPLDLCQSLCFISWVVFLSYCVWIMKVSFDFFNVSEDVFATKKLFNVT